MNRFAQLFRVYCPGFLWHAEAFSIRFEIINNFYNVKDHCCFNSFNQIFAKYILLILSCSNLISLRPLHSTPLNQLQVKLGCNLSDSLSAKYFLDLTNDRKEIQFLLRLFFLFIFAWIGSHSASFEKGRPTKMTYASWFLLANVMSMHTVGIKSLYKTWEFLNCSFKSRMNLDPLGNIWVW